MAVAGRLTPRFSSLLRRSQPVLSHADASSRSPDGPVSGVNSPFLGVFPSLRSLKGYSTAAESKEANVKVPLSLFGVAGNYASALFIAASKANTLQKVESEILDVVEASKNSPVFSQFIKDLSVPADTRVKAVQEIFSEAKFSDVTKNFLCILAENGRLRHVETIAKNFTDLTMAHRGEVKATVTTVIPLPADEEKQLKEILGTIIGQGKTIKLEQKIDQSILGGIVVEFSQKVFDMSIKTRAKKMEAFLRVPINFNDLQ